MAEIADPSQFINDINIGKIPASVPEMSTLCWRLIHIEPAAYPFFVKLVLEMPNCQQYLDYFLSHAAEEYCRNGSIRPLIEELLRNGANPDSYYGVEPEAYISGLDRFISRYLVEQAID